MRIAVLPFNAAEGTKPELGRQFAAFAAEQLRTHAGAEINTVSYLTQIDEGDGRPRMQFVNLGDELLPSEQFAELYGQAQVSLIQDGLLKQDGDDFSLTVRFHTEDQLEPIGVFEYEFKKAGIFETLHSLVKTLANQAEIGLPELLAGEKMEFGTDDPDAFINFLVGFDALNYIQQANGAVVSGFDPTEAVEALSASVEADPDFEGPYHVLIRLAQACANFRLGTFELIDKALTRLTELVPDEAGAYFGLGDVYQTVGELGRAAEYFEKAVQKDPNDPALYTRLGIAQMQSGMPVNAERNFRKALDMEGEDKPSADYLAAVLGQTGRAHEVPGLWKGIVDANPQNGQAYAKYAISLIQAGKPEEGEKVFETGLEVLDDNTVIKRYYAPMLVQKEEFDRAMDFYEDVLDVAPNDIPTLVEYAQTLEAAKREFEVPNVLKTILSSNPDPNTRAQIMARLIELEQPKRVESVENARAKVEAQDFQGAIRDLKPLRNWLADYWKLWALLATSYNQTEQFADAEDAARRLLELYPGCEPAYGEMTNAISGQGRTDEAYQFIRYAAANNPSSLPIHLNLGLAAKRAGHLDEARNLAKQIREAIGPNPELEPVLAEIES
jgi:tetratricopeptide (TPR) repeat protein